VPGTFSNQSAASTAPAHTSAGHDVLDKSFDFTSDFALFGGGDNTTRVASGTNDSFSTDFGLTSSSVNTSTTAPAFTNLDENSSYLLASLDDINLFLANNEHIFPSDIGGGGDNNSTFFDTPALLDDYLTSPIDSMSSHQLTPLASPTSPAFATSANTSPLMNHRFTPPFDPSSSSRHFFPSLPLTSNPATSSSSPTTTLATATAPNPLKRKSPSVSMSPQTKDLPPIEITETDDDRDIKRKRNTAAARRYRQKKQDQMAELEAEIEVLKEEKETIRQETLRWKMEAEKFKALVEFLQRSG